MCGIEGRGYEAEPPMNCASCADQGCIYCTPPEGATRVSELEDNIGGHGLSDGACVLIFCAIVGLVAWLL